ncbi:type I-E CRISPR-associated protein Cse1/CasA [Streptomyces sp. RY43-2]|uniref:Type I-E CRISPR-associated protein Cse1/CasA n=1 Tax=Streptomyces macrolidinus TaxID=2952607 RepID=A0ABT0ZGL5_9ACTN|nr:type I-E CRISPR-associated protein Cse1/CasA [Streptomyces macrolidinus]MCN9242708.1 type I-E CRISPR-associated protein Cse1/CasA [Streptomyces macrolidinus]
MPATMNILEESLFPVRWSPDAEGHAGSAPPRVGLLDLLLRSHEIEGLAVPDAPAHSALLRILYALTARVTGLDEAKDGPDNWQFLRDEVLEEGRLPQKGIEDYFARYRDRFFLFDLEPGGRPWMQDRRLKDQCDPSNTAGVNKLVVTRPSGNNFSWFTHASDPRPDLPTAAEAVLNLLTWHYYGPSGRCSAREVNGVTSASAKAGPLRTSLSYHPEGDTLFETLLAGLVPPARGVEAERDQCPWEWDELPDPDEQPPALTGPCSRLTAGSMHALLLVPDPEDSERVRDAYITWAYRTGRGTRPDDAYLIWQISKQGNPYPRPADAHRALWRDLDALLLIDPPGVAQPRRPAVFEWAIEVSPESSELRVRALGFEQDGQAKDTQFVDAVTPPVLGFVEKRSARTQPAVGRLRALGERFGNRLDRALRRAWRTYVNDAKDSAEAWAQEGAARYWPAAERAFWDRFALLDRTGTALDGGLDAAAARTSFLQLAMRAFDDVTASAARTQRGAKAVEEARIELFCDRRGKPRPS